MFDLINGLPVHPLVVHAVVVLLPLAVVGSILIAVRPPWRSKYGPLVVTFAAIATVLVPVATSSGESLERRVGDPGDHAQLGDQLIWFAIPLLILALTLVVLDRREARRPTGRLSADADTGRTPSSTVTTVVAALAVLAALAAAVQVYRVGDSGARAAWGDRVQSVASPSR